MKTMKTGLGFWVWGLVIAVVLCAGMVGAQQPGGASKLTPEQALANLDKAASVFQGTRADHMAIQQSLQVLAAVVQAYEQYETTIVKPKKAAKASK